MSLWISLLQVPHVSGIVQCLSLCGWLISLRLMSSRCKHVVACLNCLPSEGWILFHCMCIPRFVCPSIHGHFGYFPPFGSCESCCCQHGCTSIFSVPLSIPLGVCPEAGCCIMRESRFSFLKHCLAVFHSGCTIFIPTDRAQGLWFLCSPANTCYFLSFLYSGHPDECEVIPRFSVDLYVRHLLFILEHTWSLVSAYITLLTP